MGRVLVAWLVVAGLVAAEPTAAVELRAEPASVEVGESVVVHVTYRWPVDAPPLTRPIPSAAFDRELVTDVTGPERRAAGGMVSERWRLTVVMRNSGSWQVPRLAMHLADADGERTVRAPEVLVEVGTGGGAANLASPSGLWQPSTPPDEGEGASRWWWTLLLLPVAIGLAVWWWRRRHRRPEPTPWERFLAALPAAQRAEAGKDAGAALSRALRAYCGRRWGFDGVAATNHELAEHLRDQLPPEALRDLRRLLDHLDGLRWSPAELAKAAVQPLIIQARTWVEHQEDRFAQAAQREAAA